MDELSGGIDVAVAVAAMGKAMEVFESVEKLASVCGVLGPIFGVAGAVLKLIMGEVDSPELKYMKEQFGIIKTKLDVISDQIRDVLKAIDQSTAQSQYYPIEENLKNHFRKYMEITSAKPEFRQNEIEDFLSHYLSTNGDQNLYSLYEGVLGKTSIFGAPILETAMEYHKRDRRLMEELCARLKQLFCLGLIALMGQTALTKGDLDTTFKTWEKNMSQVEEKMKAMVERCIAEFPDQAKIDLEGMLKSKDTANHENLARGICAELGKKYDWVYWSVRVYDERCGFNNHCVGGSTCFSFFRMNGVNCVASYAQKNIKADPGKYSRIVSLCQQVGDARHDARNLYNFIHDIVPGGHLIHVVRQGSNLNHQHNFPQDTICKFGCSPMDAVVHQQ